MKYLRIISRILVGLVFIFSGFVKGIDPMGSSIKFAEYFDVLHLGWLASSSTFLAILQNTAELMIGVALLIGLRMKLTSWATLIFMSFYTVLTLYIAIANPVTDCGCFGDALVITNWQTFYKNIVLLLLAVFIFYSRNKFKPYAGPATEWGIITFFTVSTVYLSIYCIKHEPIMDFRPYHVGAHIPSQMTIPEGAPAPVIETTLYYEKEGVKKAFTIQNFPQDTSWHFVDSKNEIISEGYKPPIHGFYINDENGNDITNDVLTDPNYSFIIISYDLTKIKNRAWDKIDSINSFAINKGHNFYFLTGSPHSWAQDIKLQKKLQFGFFFVDVTALHTIMRSNPGVMLLKDGIVLAKWNLNDFPETSWFKGNILSKILTLEHKQWEWKRIFLLLWAFSAILLIIYFKRK